MSLRRNTVFACLLGAVALGVAAEALLFRGLFDLGRHLDAPRERLAALGCLLAFSAFLLCIEWPVASGLYRMGRRHEWTLRTQLLRAACRRSATRFADRPLADLAFRAHALYLPRQLPEAAGHCWHLAADIACTALGIMCVYPGTMLLAAAAACCTPLAFLPLMERRDLRYREASAALMLLHMDALQGAAALRAHAAEATMRSLQADALARWRSAGLELQAVFAAADGVQLAASVACIVALVYRQAQSTADPAGLLLLVYWAASISIYGRDLAAAARVFPAMRNTVRRMAELAEPADAVHASPATPPTVLMAPDPSGARVEVRAVTVHDGPPRILDAVSLYAEAGEHVALVGASGAGKSSLLGCLLGWIRPSAGSVRVDGADLQAGNLAEVRAATAWIDPDVHLFSGSLSSNLRYGNESQAMDLAEVLATAELERLLEHLPQGLQSTLREGGSPLSAGEAQRLRIGRALGRHGVRLAILDEPVRGLGREQRRRQLAAIRRRFSKATLLCATHDIADTLDFDRILVMERGRIVEQGCPRHLAATASSRYAAMLDREQEIQRQLSMHPSWRRCQLSGGVLEEPGARVMSASLADKRCVPELRPGHG